MMEPVQDAWNFAGPRYDRSRPGCGIAHLGVGNFVRAHLAVFLDAYLQAYPGDWTMHGVGLRPSDAALAERMAAQGNLYTLTERSGSHDTLKVIGSIQRFSLATPNPQPVIDLLASDDIKIISLTVTEKGYTYDAVGDLDVEHPEVKADLAGDTPRTAVGVLFHMARQRLANGGRPVTLMSCDNVPGNGDRLRHVLLQFAELKSPQVAAWLRDNTSCPNSMVDRITPGVTDATRAFVRDTFGIDDGAPVVSEAYLQWVLEDRFIQGRPRLEDVTVPVRLESRSMDVRVQFTDDVEPYEKLKMRLLNGAHSALAYTSYLMGFRLVDDAMHDPLIRAFVRRYMDEIAPSVPAVPGVDIPAYAETLVERFSNPAVRDQVQRLAEDGSKKVYNFIVPPLEDKLTTGAPIPCIAFALAAWFRYLRGVDEQGQPIDILDPMAAELTDLARRHPHDPTPLLAVTPVFGLRVSSDSHVAAAVKASLDSIDTLGTREALARLLAAYN